MLNLTEEKKPSLSSEIQSKYEEFLKEAKTKNNPAALYFAANNGDIELVRYLLQNGVKVYSYFSYNKGNYECKETPLWVASSEGHLKIVELLIQYGANVNKPNQDGETPLLGASRKGHLEVVRCLVDNEAEVDQASSDESTPLFVAAQYGHLNTVKYLVEEADADIDYLDDQDDSALTIAAERGHLEIVKFLVEKGADIEQANSVGDSALSLALKNGDIDTANYLRQAILQKEYSTPSTTSFRNAIEYNFTIYTMPDNSSSSSSYNSKYDSKEKVYQNLCEQMLQEYDFLKEELFLDRPNDNREDLLFRLKDVIISLHSFAKDIFLNPDDKCVKNLSAILDLQQDDEILQNESLEQAIEELRSRFDSNVQIQASSRGFGQ